MRNPWKTHWALALEFHEIWHENALGNKQLTYWKKRTLKEQILDIPANLQQGIIIIKDLSVKLYCF